MTVVLPLAIWPHPPMPAPMLEALKRAKAELLERDKLDFQLQISPAMPGSPTRVLSFVGPTPFMADVAMLRNWNDPDELRYWLEWVLDEAMDVELGFSRDKWMALNMPGAKLVAVESINGIPNELYDALPY